MTMNYRLIKQGDLNKGFIELLSQLTTTGTVSKELFVNRIKTIMKNPNHRVYVLERANKIISCATLFIEPKFIHSCGKVGHVEDVVVDAACRGQRLGKKIIDFLGQEAERLGCYKILLDCSEKNVRFYEKCSYELKGAYMARYLKPTQNKAIEPFYKEVKKFCRNHYKELGVGVVVVGAVGYYLYNNWYSAKEEEDVQNAE